MTEHVKKKRILIVDDSLQNIKLLYTSLESDYDISVATRGNDALEIAKSHVPPDLILLDILMPELDGYQVCRMLKSLPETERIPIIFLTAKDAVQDETMGLEIGAVDYITKPFSMSIIRSRIRTHLEIKAHRDNLEDLVRERTEELERVNEQLRKDIAERKRIEAELRNSEERYRNLFENAPISIFEADIAASRPVFQRVNDRAVRTFGITRRINSEGLLEMIFANSAPSLELMHETLKKGDVFSTESFGAHSDGSIIPVRLSVSAVFPPNIDQVIITAEDITAEKNRRSEEEAIAEERRRIARDIHDGVAQDLASLKLKTKIWHKLVDENPTRMHEELNIFREILNKNIREVRRSIFALRPLDIETLGFFPAIRKFIDHFSEYNQLPIDLNISGNQEGLASEFETILFRIIQETMNNIAKHAEAKHVSVELDLTSSGMIMLTIEDNGIGIGQTELSNAEQRGRLGIIQMRERIQSMNGSMSILSRENGVQGTRIRITLPFTNDML